MIRGHLSGAVGFGRFSIRICELSVPHFNVDKPLNHDKSE